MSENNSLLINDNIHYDIDFARFNEHLVDVRLSFTAKVDAPTLWLPAWIAGSYLIREFARNITAVFYQIEDHQDNGKTTELKRAPKLDKQSWQLPEVSAGQKVTVSYEVYCYDLSVRTAYVDQSRLFGNFTSLSLAITDLEKNPVSVKLIVPEDFLLTNSDCKLACGLKSQKTRDQKLYFELTASDYFELIDHPFEIASQDSFGFVVQDNDGTALAHRFFLSGRHHANLPRLQRDLTQLCQTYVNWLGHAPFSDYTFLTYASGQDYGGLEHINSTSLVTPRCDLPRFDEPELPSAPYQRFLGLCSHEYFHSWWVKTVRPFGMVDADFRREVFTPLLWVFEGFTSYIDDFMLQASGLLDKASYLTLLSDQISRYYQTFGRAHQSVAESSFDTWIKLYRADENTANAGVSYYNKGALVALCLDLWLLQKTAGQYRLFDVVRAFYDKAKQVPPSPKYSALAITPKDLTELMGTFVPVEDWLDFEARYVNGVEKLPIEPMLAATGIKMFADTQNTFAKHVPWGMRVEDTPSGLKVNRVLRDSIAAKAGISANDVIVAIDGLKADNKQFAVLSAARPSVICHLFRRDELLTVTVNFAEFAPDEPYQVQLKQAILSNDAAENLQVTPAWQAWLGGMPWCQSN
ncbi:M61 family metallopeptidase [Psychrobacter ciconiae]|uniref:M61 family metallopeptidase n=1 Tax=Psychrobacter ciconiae TaxID=1553449 RepID=UPI00191A265A|nr:PDZ domain-containing protein [Psychrobacter ciconiae]